jgi:PhzF family phenazine biosynthesis protein
MKIPYYHIDAFTDQKFCGNPAGVCPLESWLPDNLMQKIAAENKHAETAFFVKENDYFRLRWFTPLSEVDLCGHATLASAYVITHFLGYTGKEIRFETLSGTLKVETRDDLLVMDFPSRPPRPYKATEALFKGLGTEPIEILKARDVLALLPSEQDLLKIKPNFEALSKVEALGIIVTAPGNEVDFVSRFFAPGVGVPEDPVTGSSHSTLIPYWAEKLSKSKLIARQLSARGGELYCELAGDRVKIGGHAVHYLQGQIEI